MTTYLLRRLLLMIPTLFGVTVVSFAIMQLAPGDPLMSQAGGLSSGQPRDAYLVQKRDLKLDKPVLLNFNYFHDYRAEILAAAYFQGRTPEQIAAELPALADPSADEATRARLEFLRDRQIAEFDNWLGKPELHPRLAKAIAAYVQVFFEDSGQYAVSASIALLREHADDRPLQIGFLRGLRHMVPDPFVYTFSTRPQARETERVVATWKTWWARRQGDFAELPPARTAELDALWGRLTGESSRQAQLAELKQVKLPDAPYFIPRLFDSELPLAQRALAAQALLGAVGRPLRVDVSLTAPPERVQEVAENWLAYYATHQPQYEPGLAGRSWAIVADTQYAHMVVRLATFDFGRSAVKTRDPVSEKLWNAFRVSAPLMLLSQVLIYCVAVPLGVYCAVHRGRWPDRLVSLKLFFLNSVPSFVAGMLCLLFLCYGEPFWSIFPKSGLHSDDAEKLGWFAWTADFLWHACLPVACMSLFSLASLAMFSRTSMIEALGQDFIRTARAKGLSEGQVVYRHALRNALIPVITLFANFVPALLGGSVLIEALFNIPGMGRLSFESIELYDFPTLMAVIYIDAIVVMASILLADVLYVVVDPRISFGGQGDAG